MSDESKIKMRLARIGKTPWNKGLHDGTCKGFTGKHSEAAKEKMRLAKLGNKNHAGHKHSEGAKKKISESKMGSSAWNKGIKMPESFCKTMSEVQKDKTIPKEQCVKISQSLLGREKSEEHVMKVLESQIGGFWYGNVRYIVKPIYCQKWAEVNPRVHAFFNYHCVECGAPEITHSHIGHHVFYVKETCCWFNEDGLYFTNLRAPDHKEEDYFIGENPNYFVILCSHCHGKTNGNFANRKKWADHFKDLIDSKYGGKSYLTKEEYEVFKKEGGFITPV